MKKSFYHNQKEFYEEYWIQREKEGYLHTNSDMRLPYRIKIAVDMILRDFKANGNKSIRVLDIGCGEGAFGKLLTERLKDKVYIIGCDISDIALTRASSLYSCVFQADIEKNEFVEKLYNQRFDYIILLEVLEHLFRPGKVLSQCYEILKDDGVLLASFPNIAWYKYRIDMLMGNFPKNYLLYPGEHIQNFTLDSFYKLLRESGFSPIEIDGQFVFPRIFKPVRLFYYVLKRFPNLFGYQLVIKSRKGKNS